MLISVEHETIYRYERPVSYTIQSLKLTPRDYGSQRVMKWSLVTSGDAEPASFTDSFGNLTHTMVVNGPHDHVSIKVTGLIETRDGAGIVSADDDPFPIAAYLRETHLTCPDTAILALARGAEVPGDAVATAHALMSTIHKAIIYRTGVSQVETTAQEALANGQGVCQDHAHVFISAARILGIPARYVSGYLQASEDPDAVYEASHAWAEAYLPDLGWVGFDVANGVCPGESYVRVAIGLDYREAAPIRGLRIGGGAEELTVNVRVAQQEWQQQN